MKHSKKYKRKSLDNNSRPKNDAMSMNHQTTRDVYKRREIEDSIPTAGDITAKNRTDAAKQQGSLKPMIGGRVSRGN